MRRASIATGGDRHRGLPVAALLLIVLLCASTLACQEEEQANTPASASAASDVAERIGSPEPSAATEASASPSAQLKAKQILDTTQDRMSALSTVHLSQRTTVRSGGQQLQMSVESDIELPERTYSIVSSPSQIEVVTDGIKAYVRLPGQEWQTMEEALGVGLEEMGFDPPDFEAQLEFARLADRIDILPDDEVEGIPVYHLRVSMSAEDVFDEYSAMMGASGDLREVLESAQGGSVEANYYIGHDDFLLRRGEVAFTTTVLGTDLQYDGDTVFSAFNEPVDIPEVE